MLCKIVLRHQFQKFSFFKVAIFCAENSFFCCSQPDFEFTPFSLAVAVKSGGICVCFVHCTNSWRNGNSPTKWSTIIEITVVSSQKFYNTVHFTTLPPPPPPSKTFFVNKIVFFKAALVNDYADTMSA